MLAFYNGRGTAEQYIKEGKHALKWTRFSCMRFTANAVRLQLHALAYNLANFLRSLVTPTEIETWSLTSLRERLIKTGAWLGGQAHPKTGGATPRTTGPARVTDFRRWHTASNTNQGPKPLG